MPEREIWHSKISVPELTLNQSARPVSKYLAMLFFQVFILIFSGEKGIFEVT